MYSKLIKYIAKPKLYAPSTGKFWDDEHISKGMLRAHLNSNHDSASRKPEFMDKSVSWISNITPPTRYSLLLDMGCGPGLYGERFRKAGYRVVGIDYSRRSIAYAKKQTELNKSNIEYLHKNFLTVNYKEQFDLITLIWCGYSAMTTEERFILLSTVYKALKMGGKFIFDVFTVSRQNGKVENHDWGSYPHGGFWFKDSHIYLNSFYRYDEDNTVLDQTIIISEDKVSCYNIWEHGFTKGSLLSEVQKAGFSEYELFDDISGNKFTNNSDTMCVVLTK